AASSCPATGSALLELQVLERRAGSPSSRNGTYAHKSAAQQPALHVPLIIGTAGRCPARLGRIARSSRLACVFWTPFRTSKFTSTHHARPIPATDRPWLGRLRRCIHERCRPAPARQGPRLMSSNKMLIDATHPEETRVVVLKGGRVEEFDFESAARKLLRGNIFLAKVTRVEPSLQAAFVDYGGNRHGFLAFNEIHPCYYQIPVADRQALIEEEAAAEAEDEAAADRQAEQHEDRGEPDTADEDTEEAAVDVTE